MEELPLEVQQIVNFVHRSYSEPKFFQALRENAATVVAQEGLTPRVARIVLLLVPHIMGEPLPPSTSWWPRHGSFNGSI